MAKLGNFLNVSNIRGKVAGNVYSKGRSGATMRVRTKGANPRTAAQSNVRAQLAAGARFFKALTGSQLTAYKAYAATITKHNAVSGAAYSPAAVDALVALYVIYKLITPGVAFPTTPPAAPFVGDTITQTAAGSAGTITFTGSAAQTAGDTTIFLIQKLKSANRVPGAKAYRIGKIAVTPSTPFQVTITGLAAGTYAVGYQSALVATGQTSGRTFLGNVIVS